MTVKRWLFILMCAGACFGQTQKMGLGMEVSGFRVPEYDDQGQLRARLYGEHAKVLSKGEVEITNLKIEMYKEGKVVMTVFSPHCFFNTETREAHSEGRVLIESGLMTIAGRGFRWSAVAGHFEILHDSKVLVKQEAQSQMKELEL